MSNPPPQQNTQDIIRYLLLSGIEGLNNGEGLIAVVQAMRLSLALKAEGASDPIQQRLQQGLQRHSRQLRDRANASQDLVIARCTQQKSPWLQLFITLRCFIQLGCRAGQRGSQRCMARVPNCGSLLG